MKPDNPYESLLKKFNHRKIHYLLIGVSGINYYADDPGTMFSTQDCDVLVKPDPMNLLSALRILSNSGYRLECNNEPLAGPDLWLAKKILEQKAMVTAIKNKTFRVDIVTDAGRIPYEEWSGKKRAFMAGKLKVYVGSLPLLIRAKENSNREKDKAFLSLYKIQLKEMLKRERSKRKRA